MKTTLRAAARWTLASTLMFGASAAFAQEGLGDIATTVRTDTFGPIGDLLGAASFLGGLIAAIMAI